MGSHRGQRRIRTTAALCGLLTAGAVSLPLPPSLISYGLAAPAFADSSPASSKNVTLDLVDAKMDAVVTSLAKQTNMEFAIQQGEKPFGRVTVTLDHSPLDKALRTIATSANAKIERNADGVYVFSPMAAPASSAAASNPPQLSAPLPSTPMPAVSAVRASSAESTYHHLALMHAIPSEVLKIMHWDNNQPEYDPFKRFADMRQTPATTPAVIYNIPQSELVVPGATPGSTAFRTPDQANRAGDAPPAAQANQFPGGGFGGGGGGFRGGGGGFQGGGGGFQGGGFQGGGFQGGGFQGGGFQGGGGLNGQNGQTQLPEGVDNIIALQGDNSLLVKATPDGFNRIKEIVRALDIAPRQVQIKVEFVTASVSDVDALGIDFALVPFPGAEVNTNQGASTQQSIGTFAQIATGNLVAQLYATLTRGRGKVVQAPLITTTNNVPATIQITNQIPYVTTTTIVGGNGNNTSNTTQQFLQVVTSLPISARINGDDTITMQLQPQLSDTSGLPALAGGPPPTITQALTTLRTVRNGETMVLGGLIRKNESRSQSRVPILGDLPLIGSLFRTRTNIVNDSELLIFVTPTIIGETAGSGANAGGSTTVTP